MRILAGAAGEPCYMATGALTWTADRRWGVGGAGYQQQQCGVHAASPCIASRRLSTEGCIVDRKRKKNAVQCGC